MDILEKNCNKRTVSLLGMLGSGLPLLILLLVGILKIYQLGFIYSIIFYTANFALVLNAVVCGYSIYKKNKSTQLFVHLGLVVVSFIFLIQYKELISLLSGSYAGLLSFALSYVDGGFLGGATFWLSALLWIGLLGHSVMVYTNKISLGFDSEAAVEEIDVEKLKQSANEIKENASEIGKKASQNIKQTSSKLKDYVGTKTGKRNVAIIGAIIAAVVAVTVYFTVFNKTVVDVTSNLKVTFNGDSGKGYIEIDSNEIEYDINDSDMYYFISGLSYEYSPKSGKLSNGDEVTVSVIYSKKEAEELKVDVKNDTKKFKVKGLVERYDSASKVDKKIASTLKEEAADEIKDIEKKLTDITEIKTEYVASYFGKADNDYGEDYYLAVYKVTGKEKAYFSEEIKDVVYYYTVRTSGINSEYESSKNWRYDELENDEYDAVTEESQIEEGLDNLYISIDEYTKFK